MEDTIFHLENEKGQIQTCKTLFTFDTDEHSYVIFTILNEHGEESKDISAMRYEMDEQGEMTNFMPIKSEELEMVEEVYNTLYSEFGEEKREFFTIIDENGEEKVCEVIHRFTLEPFDTSYMFYIFTDDQQLENIFAAIPVEDENGKIIDMNPIESEEEWALIEQELKSITE